MSANWFEIDKDCKPCCLVSIAMRKRNQLKHERQELECPNCGVVWVVVGEKLVEKNPK